MNEFEARDYILQKGKDVKKIEELADLIEEVETKFNYGYGVAPRCIGAVSAVVANYLSAKMGITGFQASCAMWDFIKSYTYTSNECGMKLIDYDTMLYPQYDYRFEKIISKDVWELLKNKAKEKLEKDGNNACERVVEHWKSIINGNVPFGYVVGVGV